MREGYHKICKKQFIDLSGLSDYMYSLFINSKLFVVEEIFLLKFSLKQGYVFFL